MPSLEHDAHLEPGKVRAETRVGPGAEGEMTLTALEPGVVFLSAVGRICCKVTRAAELVPSVTPAPPSALTAGDWRVAHCT